MPSYTLAVVGTSPEKNALSISRSTKIMVTFNRDLAPTSLTGNFKVEKKVDDTTYTNVSGNITYASRVATFTPSTSLDASSVYRVTIVGDPTGSDGTVTGVMDIFGNGMLGNFVYSFSSDSNPVLSKPVITDPVSGTTSNVVPIVTWNAITDVVSYEVQISPASDFSVDLWATTIVNGDTTVSPSLTLVDGAYFIRLRYSVVTGTSPWSDAVRFYYSATATDWTESTFLSVVDTSPMDGSANNPLTTPITITFSDDIDSTSVTTSSIKLIELPSTAQTISLSTSANVVTITATLVENTKYEVLVKDTVKSHSGDEMAASYSYTFSSVYTPLYASYQDVVGDIVSLSGTEIDPDLIYRAIRDASIYAKELRTQVEEYYGLELTDWTDTANLPFYIKQFVRYQAGYDAYLNSYMERAQGLGSTKQLADFMIQSSFSISYDVKAIMDALKAKIQPWLDQIMNFGFTRGYAMPKSATKGVSAYEDSDFMTDRATFKEYGTSG